MTRILLATPSATFRERFSYATGGAYFAVPLGALPINAAELFQHLDGAPLPDVVVLDSGDNPSPALSLSASISEDFPRIALVLVSELEEEIGLAALRAGVRDVLHPRADIQDIQLVLDRASAAVAPLQTFASPDAPRPEPFQTAGRVISVVSPKGGVGKTTVSTNLAVGLALAEPASTVIVDLDVQFGDVATALNLAPEYSLVDTVRGTAAQDTMALKTFLSLHDTGLYAICAPESPAVADTISGEEVGRLLTMLASQFRYVVVDTAPGLSEHTLASIDRTTDLILLTSMDVPGIRGMRKELDILGELGFGDLPSQVVLNMCDPRGGLSTKDVSVTIGRDVDLELPVSPQVLTSINQGIPLLQEPGKDPMTKKLLQLVGTFTAGADQAARRGKHVRSRGLSLARSR
ncbi:AAA family ATPase [Georgenia sp. M64]|uniref:AAA family ATPase n=1 Tax=Georgenia sp. M64 TaxID=3120520 RepID=UPI0030DE3EA2